MSRTIIEADDIKLDWIRNEVKYTRLTERDAKGALVRRIQEYLYLAECDTVLDGEFGPATEAAVRAFQSKKRITVDGQVGPETWGALTEGVRKAMTPIAARNRSFSDLVIAYAQQHLKERPREVGGQNRGPWVRIYMKGKDGREWPWCAGFISTMMQLAAVTLERKAPLTFQVSCDLLASEAKQKNLFRAEKDFSHPLTPDMLPAGSIFLHRRTGFDWTHTGIVLRTDAEGFETVEGNTNDSGSREGVEVRSRWRAYKSRDFIVLPADL